MWEDIKFEGDVYSFPTINKDLYEEYVSDQCGMWLLDSSCCVQRWSDSLQYERQLRGYSCQNKIRINK